MSCPTDTSCVCTDVSQQEYLFGWRAHEYSDVFNVQFSSDETSVYSMGCDQHFCQWSINRTGDKMVDYNIHEHACVPTEGRLKGEYFPSTPQGNLFAFEDEDKFVLTCAPDQAVVYQVWLERCTTYKLYYFCSRLIPVVI